MDRLKNLISDERMAHMVDEFLAAFNRHDLDFVANWHTEDALHHQPNRSEPLRGREAIREDYLQSTWKPFPDFRFDLERAFGQGEWLCIQGTLTGTHQAPIEGRGGEIIPATGRRIHVPILSLIHISEPTRPY